MIIALTQPQDRRAELRQQIEESLKELENPKLFLITRKCIAARIATLEHELAMLNIQALEAP